MTIRNDLPLDRPANVPAAPAQPTFRKGDRVFVISSYDNQGAVLVVPCTVDSWGKKQVHLREEEAGVCMKRRYYVDSLGLHPNSARIVSAAEDPIAVGLEYARNFLAHSYAALVSREASDEWYRRECAPRVRAELHAPEVFVGGREAVYAEFKVRKPSFRPYLATEEAAPPAPAIQTFQTHRLYTVHGQRVAWCVLTTGNVAMYDLDRMIDYVLVVPGEPTNGSVQRAYDTHGRDVQNTAPWNEAEYREARDMQSALIAAARNAPKVRS